MTDRPPGNDVDEREPEAGQGLAEAVREVENAEHDRPPPIGTLGNAIVAVVVTALGVATTAGSVALGVGTAREPRAGTWPLIVGIVLTMLGIGLLVVVRRTADAERFSRASWLVLAALASMVGFVALIEVIGFEIPAALLCFVWLRFLGRESWRVSILTSVGVVAGFYLVFVAALAVPIPHLF
ncbi:MAG: tripartite tricarboxylate transporter TctB family protein [Actinophytocola sp.]|uniref:tripartite tricarboxylate transporter TctB family protein n=1 Tax=Actinophytocola sp. TaxID=1872138 RepID=UPI003D6C236B